MRNEKSDVDGLRRPPSCGVIGLVLLVCLVGTPMMCSEGQQMLMERRFKPAETMLINRVHQAHLIGASPAQVIRWLDRQGVVHTFGLPHQGRDGPPEPQEEWKGVLTVETPPRLVAHVGLIVWESELAFQFNEQHRLTSVRVRRRGISF